MVSAASGHLQAYHFYRPYYASTCLYILSFHCTQDYALRGAAGETGPGGVFLLGG